MVRVAETTDSPEVIKNFLLYQVGRDDKWGRGENSLAKRIITDIDGNLKAQAEAIVTALSGVNFHFVALTLENQPM